MINLEHIMSEPFDISEIPPDLTKIKEYLINANSPEGRADLLQCPDSEIEHFAPFMGTSGSKVPLGPAVNNPKLVAKQIAADLKTKRNINIEVLNTEDIPYRELADALEIPVSELEDKIATLSTKIAKITGIVQRRHRLVPSQSSLGMSRQEYINYLTEIQTAVGIMVLEESIKATNLESREDPFLKTDIDVLLVPSTSGAPQMSENIKRLAELRDDVEIVEISMTCPSGGATFDWIYNHQEQYIGKNIAIIAPEILSIGISDSDSSAALFTDYATGMIIEKYGHTFRVNESALQIYPDQKQALKINPLYPTSEEIKTHQRLSLNLDNLDNEPYIVTLSNGNTLINGILEIGKDSSGPHIYMRSHYPNSGENPGAMSMDGKNVTRFVLGTGPVQNDLIALLKRNPNINLVISHQANGNMIRKLEKNLTKKLERPIQVPFTHDKIGNSSAAATFSALLDVLNLFQNDEDFKTKILQPRDSQVVLQAVTASFGGGLGYARNIVEWGNFYPIHPVEAV